MSNFRVFVNNRVQAEIIGSLPSGTNNIGKVDVTSLDMGDTPLSDAFGRIRVSNPNTLFQSALPVNADPVVWDSSTSGGGSTAYVTNNSSVNLSISSGTTGTAIRQSFQRMIYQPGKSQLIYLTGVVGAGVTNAIKRLGLFDSENGIYFQQSGTTLSWVLRTYTSGSAVNTVVDQDDWNIDKFDGTGTSGLTFDPTKTSLMIIDFAWLGVGRVRCGFVVAGVIYYAHQFTSANNTTVYMSRPNLPIRYEISSSVAVPSTATLNQICSALLSEGPLQDLGRTFSISAGTTAINISTENPILAIRLKNGFEKGTLLVRHAHYLITANDNVLFRMYLRPTLSGVTGWNSITNSGVEYTIYDSGTNNFSFSNGELIDAVYVSRDTQESQGQLPNYVQSLSAGIGETTGKVALITAAQVGGGSANVLASFSWSEYH